MMFIADENSVFLMGELGLIQFTEHPNVQRMQNNADEFPDDTRVTLAEQSLIMSHS